MGFILFSIFFFVGLIVSSFTFLPVLIIFFFGIPTTKKVDGLGYLKSGNKIIRNYLISSLLLSTIFVTVYWLISTFFPIGKIGFIFGLGATLFFGLGKIGKNKENVSDYVETNQKNFTEHPGKVIEAILK